MSFQPGDKDDLRCKKCETQIDLKTYQCNGLCADCEFAKACPEGWITKFDVARAKWARVGS